MLLNKRIPLRYVINKIKNDLLYVVIFSIAVYLLRQLYRGTLPDIELSIPAFIGTAISILLSFKLSQSYDRWWEARKIWGSIVNDSRTFIIQLQSFLNIGNESMIKKMAYRQIAWCYSLGQTLRGQNPTENIEEFLSDEELQIIKKHSNKPLAMVQSHGKDIAMLKENQQIEIFAQMQLDSTLVRFVESMGMAERIKNTVFPVTYRIFLHFSIYLFIATLAIALKDMEIYFQFPLSLLVSSIFLLLEKSARHMQDPFHNKPTDTSVTAIARTIEINIRNLLGEEKVPEAVQPNGYYLD